MFLSRAGSCPMELSSMKGSPARGRDRKSVQEWHTGSNGPQDLYENRAAELQIWQPEWTLATNFDPAEILDVGARRVAVPPTSLRIVQKEADGPSFGIGELPSPEAENENSLLSF